MDKVDKYKYMNIPPKFWDVKIGQIQDAGIQRSFVERYLTKEQVLDTNMGVLLWGDHGRGKTAIASLILRFASGHGIFGHWIDHDTLINTLWYDKKAQFTPEQTLVDRIETCPILVIDEFDLVIKKDRMSDTTLEKLIRRRSFDQKKTVITTNLDTSIFSRDMKGLWSLCHEEMHIINVQGEDLRCKKTSN